MPVSIILLREATAGPSDQVISTWRSLATSSFSFLSTEAITHVWVLCLTGLFNSYWLSVPFFLHRLSESLLPSETHAHGFFLEGKALPESFFYLWLVLLTLPHPIHAKHLNIVFFEF